MLWSVVSIATVTASTTTTTVGCGGCRLAWLATWIPGLCRVGHLRDRLHGFVEGNDKADSNVGRRDGAQQESRERAALQETTTSQLVP